MKKIIICLCLFAISFTTFGKAVDAVTAQKVAYNFCKSRANLQSMSELSLAYTGTSVVSGVTVNGFYVFNVAEGFVIISADDNVMPVLGYSTESVFTTNNISPSFQYLLNTYQAQIAYASQSSKGPTSDIVEKWNTLSSDNGAKSAARTTSTAVAPLLTTKWDQENGASTTLYTYNADCPYDAAATTPGKTLTGCVATAMAQVMKHWNWPDTGVGSHSYTQYPNPDGIPAQSANFAIPFHFDSMPTPTVHTANTYVAKLMYCAGVSVDMNYGTASEDGSGAYVTSGYSSGTNCAEYALQNYFKYPAAKGYQRSHFSQTQWVDTMLNEMNSGRPVIYAGNGPQGGHCWVMDGYDNDTFFHFNWGWSGYYNGYFTVNNLTPDGDTFNHHQEAIVRIIADTPVHTDTIITTGVTNVASSGDNIRIFPNPASNTVNVSFDGMTAKEIKVLDMEGRVARQINTSSAGTVTIPVGDLPGGIYILRIMTDGGALTRKFVIAR